MNIWHVRPTMHSLLVLRRFLTYFSNSSTFHTFCDIAGDWSTLSEQQVSMVDTTSQLLLGIFSFFGSFYKIVTFDSNQLSVAESASTGDNLNTNLAWVGKKMGFTILIPWRIATDWSIARGTFGKFAICRIGDTAFWTFETIIY